MVKVLDPIELEKNLAKVRGSERIRQVRKVQHEAGQKPFDRQLAQQMEGEVPQNDELLTGEGERQGKKDEQRASSEPEEGTPTQKTGREEPISLGSRIDVTA
ncbi:MAG: hypothetical protein J7J76_05205 [Candidatus Latescibacteria bacterium]|nr:hypothetical protein [Candidatus Latescibacterota bacterium]